MWGSRAVTHDPGRWPMPHNCRPCQPSAMLCRMGLAGWLATGSRGRTRLGSRASTPQVRADAQAVDAGLVGEAAVPLPACRLDQDAGRDQRLNGAGCRGLACLDKSHCRCHRDDRMLRQTLEQPHGRHGRGVKERFLYQCHHAVKRSLFAGLMPCARPRDNVVKTIGQHTPLKHCRACAAVHVGRPGSETSENDTRAQPAWPAAARTPTPAADWRGKCDLVTIRDVHGEWHRPILAGPHVVR